MKVLVSWIGATDLRAAERMSSEEGPIANALRERRFDRVLLLGDQNARALRAYESWLRAGPIARQRMSLDVERVTLRNPSNFEEIYSAVSSTLNRYLARMKERPELTFHLSPGTPAMAAMWVILGKTRYQAELIQSSRHKGVETASLPFEINLAPEVLTDLLRMPDRQLEALSSGDAVDARQFGDMIYRGAAMRRLVDRAKRAAPRSVPVLIEGESGTGKELLAHAIHQSSPRNDQAFQVVNCGAIPSELVESELFGHVKGAFTGATKDHIGHFQAAHGGTLFLDEIGELPPSAQVKLLRALQEKEIKRVGDTKSMRVDVRVIAATNRTLAAEVAAARFREDLFYRLAVLVLKVPPLRERDGDLAALVEGLLVRINDQSERAKEPGFKRKQLSAAGKKILLQQSWPGNVRELENTLRRAMVWSDHELLSEEDIREALLPGASGPRAKKEILDRSLDEGVDLPGLMSTVARHYLRRALEKTHGNKAQAAKLVGLSSYQTFTNWMQKYDVQD
ncbi:MAG: AAA family ATPase [Hyphomicrobium sp. 32-62-53]|nr:MAG: AAA family ATPase [Hyphomicrobium sp. 12-62-95]OYX99802.1 MAG: AAA family ATPase [Hyphomicrobium sp. 32-62-53]